MEYGVSLLPDCDPETTTASQYFQDVLQVSVLADRLGLNYVKMTEHYLRSYGGYSPARWRSCRPWRRAPSRSA